jgi:hypothetical protein
MPNGDAGALRRGRAPNRLRRSRRNLVLVPPDWDAARGRTMFRTVGSLPNPN